MKKLVFAAIAAMVMVSVSNVFASKNMASVSNAAPADTVAPADTTVSTDTVAPAEQSTDTTVEKKSADLAALINVPADTTTTDSTQKDSSATGSYLAALYHHLQKTVIITRRFQSKRGYVIQSWHIPLSVFPFLHLAITLFETNRPSSPHFECFAKLHYAPLHKM